MIRDIQQINDRVQGHELGAVACAKFALLSIRTQFETVPNQVADVLNNGNASKYAWGFKRTAFAYLDRYGDSLQESALETLDSPVDLLDVFTDVPGLGLAKAGFCAQLFANQVGCLDYLNLKLYNLDTIQFPKTLTRKTKLAKIAAYVEQCAQCGSSAELWKTWCNEVGKRKSYPDGNAVSRTHVNLINALTA